MYNMNGMTGIVIFLLTTLSGGAAAFVQSASARIAPERLARMIERLPDSRGGAYLRDELAWMIL